MARLTRTLAVAALALGVSGSLVATANAGCLTGAVVGGVAGHYAHRHTLVGAAAGCAIGHHMAVEKKKRRAAEKAQADANWQASHGTPQRH